MRVASLCCLLCLPPPAGAIVGGLPPDSPARRVDADDCASPFAGVVAVQIGDGVYSGVLIADRWVLTAAHVAAGHRSNPAEVSVRVPCGPVWLGVSGVVPHPGFARYHSDRINYDDLALLHLTEAAPPAVPRYALFATRVANGTVVTLVGYGAGGSAGGALVPARSDTKRVGRNALDAFMAPPGTDAPLAYLWDFDGPSGTPNLLGGPGLGGHDEATVAGGDSGSPALVRDGEGWAVVGINTFQMRLPAPPPRSSPPPPQFGSGGGGLLVAPYAAWIRSVIASEAQTP